MNKFLLHVSMIVFVAYFGIRAAVSSKVDITEGENNELFITVLSSKPETSYSGKLGLKNNRIGHHSILTKQYKSGEEFCMYMPVVGMRNLTCYIWLTKYWDTDMEATLSDSEGTVIDRINVTASGRRSPYAVLNYINISRPDVIYLCGRNHGTTKTVQHLLDLVEEQQRIDYFKSVTDLNSTHYRTAEALDRLHKKVREIEKSMSEGDLTAVRQDYFRLEAISNWVDNRCIINSVMMVLCGAGTTMLIRRWFGTSTATV